MGLDMYLYAGPKVKELSPSSIVEVNRWLMEQPIGVNPPGLPFEPGPQPSLRFCPVPGASAVQPYVGIAGHFLHWWTVLHEVAYWRKANHIHNWFVQNAQGGKDDCDYYPVTKEQLQTLFDAVKTAAFGDEGEAQKLLPTKPGFFFGSTDYGPWYRQDLLSTLTQLNKILTCGLVNFDKTEVFYHASW